MTNINKILNDSVGITMPGGSIDKVWDTLFEPGFGHPIQRRPRGLSYEIKPNEDAVVAEVEVPGCGPKDVTVSIEGRAVHVETPRGNAYFTIGARVDQDRVEASIQHGLLTLKVPKREARRVEVQVLSNEE